MLNELFGVDFTNVLRSAFAREDPKSAKKTLGTRLSFALWGSASIKAAHKHVSEIDLWSSTMYDNESKRTHRSCKKRDKKYFQKTGKDKKFEKSRLDFLFKFWNKGKWGL